MKLKLSILLHNSYIPCWWMMVVAQVILLQTQSVSTRHSSSVELILQRCHFAQASANYNVE